MAVLGLCCFARSLVVAWGFLIVVAFFAVEHRL